MIGEVAPEINEVLLEDEQEYLESSDGNVFT